MSNTVAIPTYEFLVRVPKDMIIKYIIIDIDKYEQARWLFSNTEYDDRADAFIDKITEQPCFHENR